MFVRRITKSGLVPILLCGLVAAAGCSVEKKSLLAPTGTVLSISADSTYVSTNGTSTVRVNARNVDGSPAAEGTEIVLKTTLGQFDQQKIRIRNGEATATFRSGSVTGLAIITAVSGSITAEITVRVGSGSPGNLTVTTNPSVLAPGGGQTDVIATVTSPSGGFVSGVPVRFTTSAGTLGASEVITNAQGEARVSLVTTTTATIRASVPGIEAATGVRVRIDVSIAVSTSPVEPVAGQTATLEATIRGGNGTSPSGRFRFLTGDGGSRDLGVVSGSVTASYTWANGGGYNLSGEFTDQDGVVTRETIRVNVRSGSTTPTPGPGPTPTPSPGGPWPRNGEEVIAWAARNYPDRLAAGVSGEQRRANMEFLRDRMIEAGTCGGMQLGWNMKRGGPEVSVDFLTEFISGRWHGIDIAYDYDNTSHPLQLTWADTGPDNFIYYAPYPGPLPCR